MAEAVQLSMPPSKYFCYLCDHEISLLPSAQIICPDCSSGFVEEVLEDNIDDIESEDSPDDSDVDESEINLLNLLSIENLFRRTLLTAVGRDPDLPNRRLSESNDGDVPERSRPANVFSSSNLLRELEDTFVRGHGTGLRHIGDYFFGDDIESLSTLLLDETEIIGSPPLPKDQIKLLPIATVSKEDVDKGIQCTICMENFEFKEKVKTLPCHHYYHETCITPWLERHSTCPNCRKTVEIKSKSQRSQSCPRSPYNLRRSDQRRSSESTSVSGSVPSGRNPFRFM